MVVQDIGLVQISSGTFFNWTVLFLCRRVLFDNLFKSALRGRTLRYGDFEILFIIELPLIN
jgi:hypothetical protein